MKDLFSGHAIQYARFRPTYPTELYDWVWSKVAHFETAWDCGTGNGQVANVLADRFGQVHATDISATQIQEAEPRHNVQYHVYPAEQSPFADTTFDLITVGQALHWFDFEKFNAEVRRVAKKGAILAVWGYGQLQISPAIDDIVIDFYQNVVGTYWDKERHHVENQYADIPFPFVNVEKHIFPNPYQWGLNQLCQYLGTWSSVKKFEKTNGYSPIAALQEKLASVWGDESSRTVTFPVFAQVGTVQ
jgi:ubiquinone/menaquinone biosynthesis C-methylase UbiE